MPLEKKLRRKSESNAESPVALAFGQVGNVERFGCIMIHVRGGTVGHLGGRLGTTGSEVEQTMQIEPPGDGKE